MAVIVTFYLLVGIIIMKFVRKANGKEVIPHVNFWLSIPGNAKVQFMLPIKECLAFVVHF